MPRTIWDAISCLIIYNVFDKSSPIYCRSHIKAGNCIAWHYTKSRIEITWLCNSYLSKLFLHILFKPMLGYTYRVLTVNYLDIAIWESTVSQLANRRHHGTAVFPANKIRLLHGLSIYLSISSIHVQVLYTLIWKFDGKPAGQMSSYQHIKIVNAVGCWAKLL